jgi:hypothetical protein
MKRVLVISVLLLAFAQTGCGTVKNFQRESFADAKPYGGVEIAAAQFNEDPIAVALMWPFWTADVVLSAIGDTVALPVTVPLYAWQVNNSLAEQNPPTTDWRQFWYKDWPGTLPPERVQGGIY